MKVGYFEAQHDFYELLGVSDSATATEIRRAHRRLVWELHPDRATDPRIGDRRIKLVNLAATVLLNHAARARYDELRREAKNGRLRSPGSAPPSRNAAAPTRGSRIHRVRRRAVVTNGPGPLVVDEFVRRLVGAAVAATLLIACASERARSSGASRPRRRVDTAIVYAADYPPCPVRYAAVTRDSAAER